MCIKKKNVGTRPGDAYEGKIANYNVATDRSSTTIGSSLVGSECTLNTAARSARAWAAGSARKSWRAAASVRHAPKP